ncbi:T-cell surface glycoprotein CD3 delta chain [Salarias fasciatus]|uniref:T-cell surface glycoprotein CD3 delta chain-like n=1 Tax=Salarias fasciatus TaxID=181472 RepID=A0A672IMT8_SALFA|nr:T-cell surface glycoprotein CD3 delta chain-like [Salarias fasciatus]XP_029964924.1 T-cell surface glycoprotein CD3 delta chain-like [Salarias fasciatus]
MKRLLFSHACVLLLWTWTACVNTGADATITVREVYDGIELTCPTGLTFSKTDKNTLHLPYKDEKSGEYTCVNATHENSPQDISIYVKFRTCDNCIELDTSSIAGLAIGEVVATAVVGVAVYLFASVVRSGVATPSSKRSDRLPPRPREPIGASSDPYQRLNFRSPKDEYDKIHRK